MCRSPKVEVGLLRRTGQGLWPGTDLPAFHVLGQEELDGNELEPKLPLKHGSYSKKPKDEITAAMDLACLLALSLCLSLSVWLSSNCQAHFLGLGLLGLTTSSTGLDGSAGYTSRVDVTTVGA